MWPKINEDTVASVTISTETAVVIPPDPISEWSDADHRRKSFWDDCQGPWRALKMFEVRYADISQSKMSLRMG